MTGVKATSWIVGAVVLALLVLAGAWFGLVSPGLDAAADSRSQAEVEQSRADQLQVQLAQLKKDFANLDTFKAELATLHAQVPAELALPTLTRDLVALAEATGVTIAGITPSTSMPAVAPAAAVPADSTTADSTTADAGAAGDSTSPSASASPDTAAPAADATTAAAAAPANLFAVPVQLHVLGTYDATLAFLDQLQNGSHRLLVVNQLQLTSVRETRAAAGGMPALAPGDLDTTIDLYAYVLQDGATAPAAGAATDPAAPAAPLPVPATQPNPFH